MKRLETIYNLDPVVGTTLQSKQKLWGGWRFGNVRTARERYRKRQKSERKKLDNLTYYE